MHVKYFARENKADGYGIDRVNDRFAALDLVPHPTRTAGDVVR